MGTKSEPKPSLLRVLATSPDRHDLHSFSPPTFPARELAEQIGRKGWTIRTFDRPDACIQDTRLGKSLDPGKIFADLPRDRRLGRIRSVALEELRTSQMAIVRVDERREWIMFIFEHGTCVRPCWVVSVADREPRAPKLRKELYERLAPSKCPRAVAVAEDLSKRVQARLAVGAANGAGLVEEHVR